MEIKNRTRMWEFEGCMDGKGVRDAGAQAQESRSRSSCGDGGASCFMRNKSGNCK